MAAETVIAKPYQVAQIKSKKALRMGHFMRCEKCGGDGGTLKRYSDGYRHPECK